MIASVLFQDPPVTRASTWTGDEDVAADLTLTAVRRAPVTATGRILRAFVERYAR